MAHRDDRRHGGASRFRDAALRGLQEIIVSTFNCPLTSLDNGCHTHRLVDAWLGELRLMLVGELQGVRVELLENGGGRRHDANGSRFRSRIRSVSYVQRWQQKTVIAGLLRVEEARMSTKQIS